MKLIPILIALFFTSSIASSKPLTIEDKSKFVKFYRSWSKILEVFPDRPEVTVLFFDLDGDGTDEAVATDHSQFGETGYSWNVFQLKNDAWSVAKIRMKDETTVDPVSSIFSRPEEFYSLTTLPKSLELIVIHKKYDRRATGGMNTPQVFRISIDKEGFVKTEELANLDKLIGYSDDFHKLHRLGVETYKD